MAQDHPDDFEREKLQLEHEKFAEEKHVNAARLELDARRDAREQQFFSRNVPALASGLVAFIAVLVSIAQIKISSGHDRELTEQKKLESLYEQRRADRDYDLAQRKALQDFVGTNFDKLTQEGPSQKRAVGFIQSLYPVDLVKPVIDSLIVDSPSPVLLHAQSVLSSLADWAKSPPDTAWCMQDRDYQKPSLFAVNCYFSQPICEAVRAGSTTGSECKLTENLSKTGWKPLPRGWSNSWFEAGLPAPKSVPFPQMPARNRSR